MHTYYMLWVVESSAYPYTVFFQQRDDDLASIILWGTLWGPFRGPENRAATG